MEFTHFSRLPIELRHKIVQHALPPSRIIEITTVHQSQILEDNAPWAPLHVKDSPLLLVNRECRQETLRYLKPLVGSAAGCWKIHVNPLRDVFVLGDPHDLTPREPCHNDALESMLSQLGGRVSYMALNEELAGFLHPHAQNHGFPWGKRCVEFGLGRGLEKCGLKELLLVRGPTVRDSFGRGFFSVSSRAFGAVPGISRWQYTQLPAIAGFEENDALLMDHGRSQAECNRLVEEWCKEGDSTTDGTVIQDSKHSVPKIVVGKWIVGDFTDQWYMKHVRTCMSRRKARGEPPQELSYAVGLEMDEGRLRYWASRETGESR